MKDVFCFIPKEVVAGKRVAKPAFVTCRFMYEHWLSPSVFERLTGFRPTNQRDRAAQLKKAVTDVVAEIENVPTEGFRLVSWTRNPYEFVGAEHKFTDYAVIADPRGFEFAVLWPSFYDIVSSCGGNMSGGVLSGKFVYAWRNDASKTLTLVSECDPRYAEWKTASDASAEKKKSDAPPTISKRELVPGKVYRAAKVLSGDWMYVGVFDAYSAACHQWAYDHDGVYNVDKFISDESGMFREKWRMIWPTARGKMVFYSMKPQMQQYVMRSDISGIFSGEAPPAQCTMYNSPLPATLENVLDDISRNPGFQRIDFSGGHGVVSMPFNVFKFWFGNEYMAEFDRGMYFPFYNKLRHCMVQTREGYILKIIQESRSSTWITYNLTKIAKDPLHRASLYKTWGYASYEQMYNIIQPVCEEFKFENGKRVDPVFSSSFCPKDMVDLSDKLRLYY